MKFSTRARYGLRMMVEIARKPGADLVSLSSVAQDTKISKRYLDQLALALKTSSLVRSTRGIGGGYQLSRPAEEISIAQIIEAAIGPINIVECVLCPERCVKSDCCECRQLYTRINREIVNVLSNMSLAELVRMNASVTEAASGGAGCPVTGEFGESGLVVKQKQARRIE